MIFLKMGKNLHNYAFQLCYKNQLKIMIFSEVMVKNNVKNCQNILFKLSREPLIPNLGVIEVGKSNETILFCVKTFFNPMRGGWGCFCPLGRPSRGTVRRLLLLIRCNMRAGSCNYSNEVPSLTPPPSLIIYSLNKYFLE